MRIAYYSPLRPLASGISDYSEELLPELARLADVTLFVDGFEPASPAIRDRFEVRNFNVAAPDGFDACLYHMGNNADYHAGIYGQLCERPGVVVLHDWVLHNFVAGVTIRREDTDGYLREMAYNYGADGHALAQALFRSGVPPVWEVSPLRFPLNRRVIERSRGVIAHSRFVADRVRRVNALVPLARIPHGMAAEPEADVAALRRKHGLPADGTLIATFGHVNPWKRLDVICRALARLAPERAFRFLVVGGIIEGYDAAAVVANAGLAGRTRFLHPDDLAGFRELIALCDVAVNLRFPTLGETSGAVLRILAAGRPCVVSDVGWFGELPDDCVAKVPADHPAEVETLAAVLNRLLDDGDLRRRLGANARALIAAEHPWRRAAEQYVAFIERVLHRPADHIRTDEVIRDVARELSDMGLPSDDDWLIPEVAEELAALCEPVARRGTEAEA